MWRRFFSSVSKQLKTESEKTLLNRINSFERDSVSNLSSTVLSKLDFRLFANPAHPVGIVKSLIWDYFRSFRNESGLPEGFECFDHYDPLVTVEQNFDTLCFPGDHVGRSRSDSYFINQSNLLRTHMTANEAEFLKSGKRGFLIAGDVYRRDEIDSTHYPVFHQLEGVRIFSDSELSKSPVSSDPSSPLDQHFPLKFDYEMQRDQDVVELRRVTDDLYFKLTGLMRHLFGPNIPIRWQSCHFPFTRPSYEIEIQQPNTGKWLEVCGCGVLQRSILSGCGVVDGRNGWAFGLGLERLAMLLFEIPDIRLFWSEDARFTSQFAPGRIKKFLPFSKYPATWRDISFWVNEPKETLVDKAAGEFDSNGFFDIIRQHARDLIEDVKMIDMFKNELGRVSQCYRITYRAVDRTLTDEEVNVLQDRIRAEVSRNFNVALR